MSEPVTATGAAVGLKWLLTIIGSTIGSAVSLVVMPAKNHKDAALRGGASMAITVCLAPVTTRFVAARFSADVESLPDITLAVASLEGLASWSLIGGYCRAAARYSDSMAENGLAGLFIKKQDK